jgi:hypothetical protein
MGTRQSNFAIDFTKKSSLIGGTGYRRNEKEFSHCVNFILVFKKRHCLCIAAQCGEKEILISLWLFVAEKVLMLIQKLIGDGRLDGRVNTVFNFGRTLK